MSNLSKDQVDEVLAADAAQRMARTDEVLPPKQRAGVKNSARPRSRLTDEDKAEQVAMGPAFRLALLPIKGSDQKKLADLIAKHGLQADLVTVAGLI